MKYNFIILQQQLALQEVYQDTSSVVLYFQMQLQELPLKKYLNNIISYEYKNIIKTNLRLNLILPLQSIFLYNHKLIPL